MKNRTAILAAVLGLSFVPRAGAEELSPKHREAVDRGLTWLVKNQHRDGHWSGVGDTYTTPMTALAGLALLAEGSTLREGRYAANLHRATDWMIGRAQPSGLISGLNDQSESGRYMYSHGFGMWFLAQVYADVEDADRRKKLEAVLTRAVQYSAQAQTTRGGWGYVSAKDGNDFDEGAVTFVQLHALYAARNAGIPVPKELRRTAMKYLTLSQANDGGLIYSLAGGAAGGSRPTISAGALAVVLGNEEVDRAFTKKLLSYVATSIPPDKAVVTFNISDINSAYSHFYLSQAARQLGEGGHAKLLPDSRAEGRLTWSRYRDTVFDLLVKQQNEDGSWSERSVGPVFGTSLCLMILQQGQQ
jgi:hypothetical protein